MGVLVELVLFVELVGLVVSLELVGIVEFGVPLDL